MASCIPAATPQLLSIITTALPSNAYVWVGKELGVFSAPVTFELNSITSDQQPAALGPDYKREETFEFNCRLTSFQGDTDQQSRLQEVYVNLALIEVAIGNNATLNNTVRFAEIGAGEYQPDTNGSGGSIGTLAFQIRCSQRITSLT